MCVCVCEWVCMCVSEWVSVFVHVLCVSMSVCVRACVTACVCVRAGREKGRACSRAPPSSRPSPSPWLLGSFYGSSILRPNSHPSFRAERGKTVGGGDVWGGRGPGRMLPSRVHSPSRRRIASCSPGRRSRARGAGAAAGAAGREPGVAGEDAPAHGHAADPGLPATQAPACGPTSAVSSDVLGPLSPLLPLLSHQLWAGGKVCQHADRTAAGAMEEDRGGTHGGRGERGGAGCTFSASGRALPTANGACVLPWTQAE